jgi:hypothetical protein
MIWVTEVKALPEYRLWLRFSDGSQGNIDLKEFIFTNPRPVASALHDLALFAAVQVEMDMVVWGNGFDLAPEFLHARVSGSGALGCRPARRRPARTFRSSLASVARNSRSRGATPHFSWSTSS